MTTDTNWAYRNYLRWKKNHPKCAGKLQSPINIDTSNVSDCNQLCKLSVNYKSSTCHISNNNRTPIIRYNPGSYIKFKNNVYELTKFTIHTPSMHTVNNEYYDMEIQLHHCLNAMECSSGGIIMSVFLQRGSTNSNANSFISQFINQIPSEETTKETHVIVRPNWNANMLFPKVK